MECAEESDRWGVGAEDEEHEGYVAGLAKALEMLGEENQ